ncbi:D-glycero-beta-D-manno-heptose-7-phosphate kinase [Bdellovibrionota bacterium FG-2]
MKLNQRSNQRFKWKIENLDFSRWNRARLESILADFAGKRVLVIGDVGVDRYTLGTVERISPEAPIPIVLVQEEKLKLGLAANVADNVQALEGTAWMVGVVGKDHNAQDLKKLLKKSGVSGSYLVADATRRTVLKERVVSDRQQLLRIDYENSHEVSSALERSLRKKIKDRMRVSDVVILQDYAKGMIQKNLTTDVFELAKRHGKVVAVDPNSKTPIGMYAGASVLTPNAKEAEQISGVKICDEQTLCEAGATILKKTGAHHVVITRGKEGMAIFTARSRVCQLISTYAQEVYDVSGAGDTVISVLALALASGAQIHEACILANLAAAVEVGKRGTATVSVSEILAVLDYFAPKA